MITVKCQRCGKEFKTYKSKKKKFCSQDCYFKCMSFIFIGRPVYNGEPSIIKKCLTCGNDFKAYKSILNKGGGKYCSRICRTTHILKTCSFCGKTYFSEKHRENRSKFCSIICKQKSLIGKFDESGYHWKGDNIGYAGVHVWAKKHLGIHPNICQHCGKKGKFLYRKDERKFWNIDFANKSGLYLRDLTDWLFLCKKCHKKYDLHNNLPHPEFTH